MEVLTGSDAVYFFQGNKVVLREEFKDKFPRECSETEMRVDAVFQAPSHLDPEQQLLKLDLKGRRVVTPYGLVLFPSRWFKKIKNDWMPGEPVMVKKEFWAHLPKECLGVTMEIVAVYECPDHPELHWLELKINGKDATGHRGEIVLPENWVKKVQTVSGGSR